MMFDEKGCGLIVGGLALLGMFIGLVLNWVGLVPWWGVLVGAGLPVVAALAFVLWGILSWMADGSH
jgi:hypothetical protein